MKKLSSLCSLLFLSALPCKALDITFYWDALPAEEEITQYSLLEQTAPDTYEEAGHVAGTVTSITVNIEPGSHTYVLAAQNIWGNSLSDPVTLPAAKPSKPGPLKVKIARMNIESSPDLKTWEPVVTVDVPVSEDAPAEFFRLAFLTE